MRLVRPVTIRRRPTVVAIGGSTGGAAVIHRVLSELPSNFPASVLITVHLPPGFAKSVVERLDVRCSLPVKVGIPGAVLAPGMVWLAPDDGHLRLQSRAGLTVLEIDEGPPVECARPAVDAMFASVAEHFGPRAVGVVVSGMGHDGLAGAEALRGAGADVLVQDSWTATAWGMPGAVARAGLASDVMPPNLLAPELVRRVMGPGTGEWEAAS